MVDITGKLVKQSQDSINAAPAGVLDNFMPEIPKSKVNTELPTSVVDSLSIITRQSQANVNNERRRLDETTSALKTANVKIDDATRNIQDSLASPLLDFKGIFDEQYNRKFQQNRITEAKRGLEIHSVNQDLERQAEALDLKEASIPMAAFKQHVALKGSLATLSAQEANAIIQSNAARKQYRAQLQQASTDDEIETIFKTGNYTAIWPAQEVKKYRDDKAVFKENMEAKQLANASNRLDLSDKIQTRALAQMPITYLKSLIDTAVKNKTSIVQVAKGVTVPLSTLQKTNAAKLKQQDEDFVTTSQSQLQLVKNDGLMSAALSNVVNSSAMFTGNGQELTNLPKLNLLNITEETMRDFPIQSIHPTLRPGFQTVLGAAAILNEKSEPTKDANGKIIKPAAGVTTQDLFTFKQTVEDLNTTALKLQADTIETAADKGSKAAFKEWFANGRMQTQDNSAAMLVSNIISLPSLGDDIALQAMHSVLQENVAKDILKGEDIDFANLDEGQKANLIFKSIADSGFKGKITSRDKVIKGLHARNAQGQTPKDAYVDTRILEITTVSMNKLAEKHPEYLGFFKSLRTETGFVNPSALAGTLAELSFRLKEQNPDLPDFSLNQELLDIMNTYIDSNKIKWNSQLNPVRGSLMNLGFNSAPAQLVDDALTTQFGQATRSTWEDIKEAIAIRRQQGITPETTVGGFTGHIRPDEATIFSPIPLPK